MAYLQFNKAELVNLEYSLKRELLATNRTGGYCNTTIVGCNTRKYHGLFAVPIERFGGHRYMLLSSLDETLLQHGMPFNLGIHCYGEVYEPRGHKYIVDFEMDPYPVITYRVGGMLFRKELLFVVGSDQLLIRYTLLDAHSHTVLRLKPYLAFRSIHELTMANGDADTHYTPVEGGVSFCLYRDFPSLYLQLSKHADYVHVPDWYRNTVYKEEYRRGFDCQEDLLVPGFFEMPMKKGESIVFSASTAAVSPKNLKAQFTREAGRRMPRDNYDDCLKAAADQLFANKGKFSRICTGFSWHEIGGMRETCLSLPGLTLFNTGNVKLFEKILSDLMTENEDAFLHGSDQVESPLRLFEAVQQLAAFTGDRAGAWKKYGKFLKQVMESYLNGRPEVQLHANGLLWAEKPGVALSWMNAYIDGKPVTERRGYQVETNCFWYNAVCYTIEMETLHGKHSPLTERLAEVKDAIENVFYDLFWVEARHHLADYVDETGQNIFTRPNQLYACALEYSPVSEEVQADILHAVERELVTTRGIRTLSPKNPRYRSRYDGNQIERDTATHNGCTRPWLLGAYVAACFKLFGPSFVRKAQELIDGFQEDLNIHGIAAVAEIYDGDPPYNPHGAINSAMSVAEILRVKYLISQYKDKEEAL
ncbi:MAG: glycogen debranching enzyme family protein [Bacteroidales bacterium]|nr:glycogen debranching enzyme family protein [Bacteroidales bacterium]